MAATEESAAAFWYNIASKEEETGMLAPFNAIPLGSIGDRVPFGSSDPMALKFFSQAFRSVEPVRQGMVVFYNPNTHTATVLVQGTQSIWPCIIADEPLSFSFGFSATYPPREGELVLVMQMDPEVQCGVIVGRVPYPLIFDGEDMYNDPDQYHRRMYSQDDLLRGTWDRNIPGMMKPMREQYDGSTQGATHFRPTDVYPGEFAHVNQHNCGIKGGMFSATLLGGGASLRMSALSNLARLTCEFYQRYSLYGSVHEFHNGRYLSSERAFTLYQEERLGGSKPGDTVWTEDSRAPVGTDGKGEDGENQTMRPRFKELSGYFGHLVSKFCLRPDPLDSDIRVQGQGDPREEGVSRETVDPSGQYRLSAAGMIAIERTGRIPVPVRKAYPTDPYHAIENDPERLTPFEHDETDPGMRQVELYDRQAYDLKNQYSRVDGLGTSTDYDVPEEIDLKPLQDAYDPKFFGNETVKLKKFDKRRAGVYIGEDGSVIIRDAWGSEIVMLGGNVSISCAGNVLTLPGQTALTIAGDDIVQKAQNSVDIHASEHDVRLSAARNMEILGGGDEEKYSGGVIIESRGKASGPWDGEGKGEDASVSGITLRTKNQAIVVDGNKVNLRAQKDMRVVSGGDEIDGNLSIAAKSIRARAERAIVSAASGKAHVSLDAKSVSACAESIGLHSEQGFSVTKGSKVMVPYKWEDNEDVASKMMPKMDENTGDLADEKGASADFDRQALDKMVFGFRKSSECRTDKSWVIGGSGDFKMYEPAWLQVMKVFETLMEGKVEAKTYKEDAKWSNGRPFPGENAENSGLYVELPETGPQNLAEGGMNVPRHMVKSKSAIRKVPLKDGYKVRK